MENTKKQFKLEKEITAKLIEIAKLIKKNDSKPCMGVQTKFMQNIDLGLKNQESLFCDPENIVATIRYSIEFKKVKDLKTFKTKDK